MVWYVRCDRVDLVTRPTHRELERLRSARRELMLVQRESRRVWGAALIAKRLKEHSDESGCKSPVLVEMRYRAFNQVLGACHCGGLVEFTHLELACG